MKEFLIFIGGVIAGVAIMALTEKDPVRRLAEAEEDEEDDDEGADDTVSDEQPQVTESAS